MLTWALKKTKETLSSSIETLVSSRKSSMRVKQACLVEEVLLMDFPCLSLIESLPRKTSRNTWMPCF